MSGKACSHKSHDLSDLTTVESGSLVSISTMLHQIDEFWMHLNAMFGLSRQLVVELDPRVNQAWPRVPFVCLSILMLGDLTSQVTAFMVERSQTLW